MLELEFDADAANAGRVSVATTTTARTRCMDATEKNVNGPTSARTVCNCRYPLGGSDHARRRATVRFKRHSTETPSVYRRVHCAASKSEFDPAPDFFWSRLDLGVHRRNRWIARRDGRFGSVSSPGCPSGSQPRPCAPARRRREFRCGRGLQRIETTFPITGDMLPFSNWGHSAFT